MNMDNYVTKQDLRNALKENNKLLAEQTSTQTEEILGVMETFMHQVDERFNKVEKDIQDIKESIDRLINTLDGFAKRLDDMETDNAARDAQYRRLVSWAEEISKKTGIPMPQL